LTRSPTSSLTIGRIRISRTYITTTYPVTFSGSWQIKTAEKNIGKHLVAGNTSMAKACFNGRRHDAIISHLKP